MKRPEINYVVTSFVGNSDKSVKECAPQLLKQAADTYKRILEAEMCVNSTNA